MAFRDVDSDGDVDVLGIGFATGEINILRKYRDRDRINAHHNSFVNYCNEISVVFLVLTISLKLGKIFEANEN